MDKKQKLVQVAQLPTEDISNIAYTTDVLEYDPKGIDPHVTDTQHLYLISPDAPYDGDWVIETANDNLISQFSEQSLNQRIMGCWKIVATTNHTLAEIKVPCRDCNSTASGHKHGIGTKCMTCWGSGFVKKSKLPIIPNSFLKKYAESNGSIKSVQLELEEGDWVFERSSGYAGHRCRKCGTWVYDYAAKDCKCNEKFKIRNDNTVIVHKAPEQKILEENGFKYSRKPFPGHTHRAIAQFEVEGDEHFTNIDIYTTNDKREKILDALLNHVTKQVKSVTIIHLATKEQDDNCSRMLDEWLKED